MNFPKILGVLAVATLANQAPAAEPLKALIIDGQNNHDWRACTPVLKWILNDSGRFAVSVSTTPAAAPTGPRPPKAGASDDVKAQYEFVMEQWKAQQAERDAVRQLHWMQWRPKFSDYAVLVCNYTGEAWPAEVRDAFTAYVRGGGGLVIVHAADNAFPEWPDYNAMIGVGGWGGRNETSGPMIRWRDGKMVLDTTPGPGGTHGAQHEFVVETRAPEHPIMRGLPVRWKHASDELYSMLRGPATNVTVLATAYAAKEKGGTGEHEPVLMVIPFGKGRVFHTVLGHGPSAMYGLGFQATLARGAEWAATGEVTLPAPTAAELTEQTAAIRRMRL